MIYLRHGRIMLAVFVLDVTVSQAAFIDTSAGCGSLGSSTSCDSTISDDYGYLFRIADNITEADEVIGGGSSRSHSGHPSTSNYYHATLTNRSPAGSDALIDRLLFNINADLDTDFTIENVDPNWTFSVPNGNAIEFDYVGDRESPSDRVAAQDSLIFDFVFDSVFLASVSDPLALWTGTDAVDGNGTGGGDDAGQIAVSFQSLGSGGGDSDLLASNWDQGGGGGGGAPPGQIPIPHPLLLILPGVAAIGYRYTRRRF